MPKDSSRSRRVAEQIQRELADLIQLDLKDPRVGMITLTGVDVTSDYSHAKIYFSLLGDQERLKQALEGLNSASGYLRSQVARRMKLRIMPVLHFVHDPSIEEGMRIDTLIANALAEDTRNSIDK